MSNNPAVKDSYWAILPNIFADIAIELGTWSKVIIIYKIQYRVN